jgi:hypothetical protein
LGIEVIQTQGLATESGRKKSFYEDSFTVSHKIDLMRALEREVRLFSPLLAQLLRAAAKSRTSAAKAVKRAAHYGTAEAVPFVRQSLPQPLRCCPNWPTEKFNLDRCG